VRQARSQRRQQNAPADHVSGLRPARTDQEFQQETGITVEVTDSSNEDMIAKLRATRGGGFDLAQPSQTGSSP